MFVWQQNQYHTMTMDESVDVFQNPHSTDQPICKQCKCKAAEKWEHKEADQKKDAADKRYTTAHCKNNLSNNYDPHSKCALKHAKAIDMLCCDYPVPITSGITKTIASLWDHPPISHKTKPLKLATVHKTDAIVIAPTKLLLQSPWPQRSQP